MPQNKLIIFVKNEEAGKTKTRLAASIGDQEALEVYRKLLHHTFQETKDLQADKEVWYSRYLEEKDVWSKGDYRKIVQQGADLGERMSGAFERAFSQENRNGEKVVVIGSDCAELTQDVLEEAFNRLEEVDFVLGPATDGGYYLIGMKAFYPQVFSEIEWSTNSVLSETKQKIRDLDLKYENLRPLNDVDTLDDWLLVKEKL